MTVPLPPRDAEKSGEGGGDKGRASTPVGCMQWLEFSGCLWLQCCPEEKEGGEGVM